jgi:hypothetical protein
LRFDPRSIRVASREPLRFAVLGRCYRPPRLLRRSTNLWLATVDVASNDVRVFELQPAMLSRTLTSTAEGGWRWLAFDRETNTEPFQLQLVEIAPGDAAPRAMGAVKTPFEPRSHVRALRGDGCWLLSGTNSKAPPAAPSPGFTFVEVVAGAPQLRATPALRGMRFWHSREQAFVVHTTAQQTEYALLDCAGNQRPLPEPDASRMRLLGRDGEAAIAPNGDWLFASQSGVPGYGDDYDPEDEIHFLHDKSHDVFGPFTGRETGCTDTGCDFETDRLEDPEWSSSGKYFLVQGYPRGYVLKTGGVQLVHKLRYFGSPGRALFLSDSLLMTLSKSRGVKFYRW